MYAKNRKTQSKKTKAKNPRGKKNPREGLQKLPKKSLDLASSLIGKGEAEKNNQGPFIDLISRKANANANWCAHFISYVLEESYKSLGHEMPFKRSGGALKLFNNVKKAGGYVSSYPVVGSLVLWDRGVAGSWQKHIGIVSDLILNESQKVIGWVSIEGNTGTHKKTKGKVRKIKHNINREKRLEGFVTIPDPQVQK